MSSPAASYLLDYSRCNPLCWLCNFYTGRTQCTKDVTTLSDVVQVLSVLSSSFVVSGVIQCRGLGPLISLVYIDELAESLANYGIELFSADDIKVYGRIIHDVHTGWPKKVSCKPLSISSPNINRFSIFFTSTFCGQFVAKFC